MATTGEAASVLSVFLDLQSLSFGQANHNEGFGDVGPTSDDGTENLVDLGWIFRNQSDARGAMVWYRSRGWNLTTSIDPQAGGGVFGQLCQLQPGEPAYQHVGGLDGDGEVDLDDWAAECLSGPKAALQTGCERGQSRRRP